jgi:uncharacterized membrane protein
VLPDLKKYASQTQTRLVIGLFALVFTVGLILIYLFYGPDSALLGLLCLMGILVPVFIILLILDLVERFVKNDRE